MTAPTDNDLLRSLAEMLPDVIEEQETTGGMVWFKWKKYGSPDRVRPTEYEHLTWLAEERLTNEQYAKYGRDRTMMAKVKHPKNDILCGRYVLSMPWTDCVIVLRRTHGMEEGK